MKLLEYDRIRRREIDQQAQKYNAERDIKKNEYDAQMGNYRRVVQNIEDNVRSNLEQVLPYSDLIDIRVSRDYDWGSGAPYLSVKISYDLNKTKNQSLAWSYSVGLDRDGNIKKESNSWSGLNAVTQEQLDDLEKSIEILKKLNIINWESILKTDVPSVRDYVTTKTLPEKDFTFEQFNADLEDFVGQDVIFISKYLNSENFYGSRYGYIIKRLTNKRVEYVPIYDPIVKLKNNKDYTNYIKEQSQEGYTETTSKEKLLKALGNDYIIVDFNGNEIGD